MGSSFGNLFRGMETLLPLAAILLVVAVLHRKRHPRVAAVIACGLAACLAVLLIYQVGLWIVVAVAVPLAGIGLALARRTRHPRVSSVVACSLGACLVAMLMHHVGPWLLLRRFQEFGMIGPHALYHFYLASGVALPLVQTGAVAGMFVAAFGWREHAEGQSRRDWQFSIRGLLWLTLLVAALCGLVRMAVEALGVTGNLVIPLLQQVPMLTCWIVGAWVAIARWSRHPPVSGLVLAAVGVSMVRYVGIGLIFYWMIQADAGYYGFRLLEAVSAIAAAAIWAFLIAAALGWRDPLSAGSEPPARA